MLFLVCSADLVTQRKDICSAVRLFLFEKVLRVLEIEEGEADWSRGEGLGGSVTFESLPRRFPGVSKPPTRLACLHFVIQTCMKSIIPLPDNVTPLQRVWLVFGDSGLSVECYRAGSDRHHLETDQWQTEAPQRRVQEWLAAGSGLF